MSFENYNDLSELSSLYQTETVGVAIILAGGFGIRLRDTVPDLPKCMAPVAGRPFLSYVIDELRMQGIERFIFSLGYKAGIIQEYLNSQYPTLDYSTVIETEPLGTGGAIQLALRQTPYKNVLVANGDTLFKINVAALADIHESNKAECTLALKPMKDFERYGSVLINSNNQIKKFAEKQFCKEGTINGGIYLLRKADFLNRNFPEKFSFEKDYLEKFAHEGKFYGSVHTGYFIDIGIPVDFEKAQSDLKRPELDLSHINKTWTLFLDRDGVINNETVGTYVKHWNEFIFSKGVLEIFKKLSDHFGHIVVVSNQRGVGRGLMTEADLQSIHLEMQREVEIVGGRIDKIYYCTEKDDHCFYRKPNPGMAFKASREIQGIDLHRSIMVGNKPSDMKFGRQAGMFTVFVKSTNPDQPFPHPDIDAVYGSLSEFASEIDKPQI
jgi:D-glycero-alpha-D-manno-heptose 1-phosphate guanylyltransferase